MRQPAELATRALAKDERAPLMAVSARPMPLPIICPKPLIWANRCAPTRLLAHAQRAGRHRALLQAPGRGAIVANDWPSASANASSSTTPARAAGTAVTGVNRANGMAAAIAW